VAQRVSLLEDDRVDAVDAGLEVSGRAPQRLVDELLLGSWTGIGDVGQRKTSTRALITSG
jgi:hypothetical protein